MISDQIIYNIIIQYKDFFFLLFTVPAKITNLGTPFVDTSFLVVNWTGPSGQNLSYGVFWTNGSSNWTSTVNEQSVNITNLTPGVQYKITVWAVASDNRTKGENGSISVYTRKCTFKFFL